jgi:hypothetical protein
MALLVSQFSCQMIQMFNTITQSPKYGHHSIQISHIHVPMTDFVCICIKPQAEINPVDAFMNPERH